MADLDSLHERIRACQQCALHSGRTQAVPGEGDPHASLMFIGEGPGFNEDRLGSRSWAPLATSSTSFCSR